MTCSSFFWNNFPPLLKACRVRPCLGKPPLSLRTVHHHGALQTMTFSCKIAEYEKSTHRSERNRTYVVCTRLICPAFCITGWKHQSWFTFTSRQRRRKLIELSFPFQVKKLLTLAVSIWGGTSNILLATSKTRRPEGREWLIERQQRRCRLFSKSDGRRTDRSPACFQKLQ